jgi:inosose dehydratase
MDGTRMRIGTAPISWGACEIPQWGDQLPYARVLDEMHQTGYVGTELGPWGYLPTDATTLRRELDARALALVGAFCPVTLHDLAQRDDAIDTARETIGLLADLRAPVLVLADAGSDLRTAIAGRVPPDGSASFRDDEWARFCDGVNEIAQVARDGGLVTAFHPHVASFIEAPHEIDMLLDQTDADLVGLCLDTGHIAYGGGDIADIARRHAGRIRHVHLKDVRDDVRASAVARGIEFRDAVGEDVFAPLGEGSLDLRGVLSALDGAGYSGWLIVEQDVRLGVSTRADPKADAKRSRSFLREAIGA